MPISDADNQVGAMGSECDGRSLWLNAIPCHIALLDGFRLCAKEFSLVFFQKPPHSLGIFAEIGDQSILELELLGRPPHAGDEHCSRVRHRELGDLRDIFGRVWSAQIGPLSKHPAGDLAPQL